MKTFFLLFLVIIFVSSCTPNTYRVEPINVVLRKQLDNSLITRYFPPQKIIASNGEIAGFKLVVKNLKSKNISKGVIVDSNLVDAIHKSLRSNKQGILIFYEPIGRDPSCKDKNRFSRYGKITRERIVYPRFWAVNKKGERISKKLEIPIKILKKREERQ